ncbi:MAG: sigma 54-interacting transcriptional regulator [Deltaproteobacteria bacterium]|nr:sigma 54-interacting transcriptional regulator [Deltaproteobacteria bacterium]
MERCFVLVVEDEDSILESLSSTISDILRDSDFYEYRTEKAKSFADVKDFFDQNAKFFNIEAQKKICPLCVILDHNLGASDKNGLETAIWLKNKLPYVTIIALSSYHKNNYKDYVNIGAKVVEKDNKEKFYGEVCAKVDTWMKKIIGYNDPVQQKIRQLFCTKSDVLDEAVEKAAISARETKPSSFALLIHGKYGCGKNHMAKVIHNVAVELNKRAEDKLEIVSINAEKVTQDVRIALFGSDKKDEYIPGAFRNSGNGTKKGTVVIDEVGSYCKDAQVLLLTVISPGLFKPVFGKKDIRNETWVIMTTNKLHNLIPELKNRCISLQIPPLAERQDDIPDLVDSILKEEEGQYSLNIGARLELTKCKWNNIRDLKATIELTCKRKKAKAENSYQIGPEEILWNDEHHSEYPSPKNEKKTITPKRDSSSQDVWLSKLDKNKLIDVCRKIWETKGGIIDNRADNIPNQFRIFPNYADLYIKAVLAIFYEAHRTNKKIFNRISFDKIFGFKQSNQLKNFLQKKSKSSHFPVKAGNKVYGITHDLRPDGVELKKNGIALDVGGS